MDDLESIDEAIGQLEGQRSLLGDKLVDTVLQLLREKRAALLARQGGEQRRLLTVLFADLVDFTVLSRALDPEDVRRIVNAYFAAWKERVEANGGVVEKFIGDAAMAVFGLSAAQEDDPRRAVQAALEMRHALQDLNRRVAADSGVRLEMRVGIDTGEVVVSTLDERPGHEFVVVGETVNRASRLQGAAPPGGIMMSTDTQRHVRGWFEVERQPGLRLKGFAVPVDGYLVKSQRQVGFWLEDTRGVEGVRTDMVGRDAEMRFLQERFFDVVEDRRLGVVTVVGDAGVGKSRLLFELERWLTALPQPVLVLRGRASSGTVHSPRALLRDLMAIHLGIQESDDPPTIREKWERGTGPTKEGAESTPAGGFELARWLGFRLVDQPLTSEHPDPEGLHERAKEAFVERLRGLSGDTPVVMVLEDLHWADGASLTFLDEASPRLSHCPVLLVAAARPTLFERHPHWGEGLAFHSRLELPPLSRRDSRRLLAETLKLADEVPEPFAELLVEASEGNPYYLEELVKFLVDTGVITTQGATWHVHEERVADVRVPPTLKGVLQARVDALTAPERLVLQRASVIGRVFWDAAVGYLRASGEAPVPGLSPHEVLDDLRRREVVYARQRSSFDATREFIFKHAMLRDVTYEGVLRSRRQEYHAWAARWLEGLMDRTGRHDEYAGVIGAHFDRANERVAASRWYLRAGQHAAGVFALSEAARFLERGLELAPDTEPALRVDLLLEHEAVLHRRGDAVGQEADLGAAEEALAGLNDPARRVRHLLARCRWLFHQSAYEAQAAVADEAAKEAVIAGLLGMEAHARLWWGKALTWHNDHGAARHMLADALAKAQATSQPRLAGEALRSLAIVAINQNEFSRAADLVQGALQVHRADGDLEGETAALVQLTVVLYNQGRYREARDCLEKSLPVLVASGYRYRQAIATSNLGSVAAAMGELGAAKRWLSEGLRLCRELGDKEGSVSALSDLGDIHRRAGDATQATALFAEALEMAVELNWAYVRGEVLLSLALLASGRGDHEEAIRSAEASLDWARRADSALARARALFGLARALDGAERTSEAVARLREALSAAEGLSVPSLVTEVRAALAKVLLRSGGTGEAVTLATRVLDELDLDTLLGGIDPGAVYLACWEVLSTTGDPRASDAGGAARRYLREATARIDDDELRESFLRTPAHTALAELLPQSRADLAPDSAPGDRRGEHHSKGSEGC